MMLKLVSPLRGYRELHRIISGGFAALHPRLFKGRRSAAAISV
jgi:hypothetical protein